MGPARFISHYTLRVYTCLKMSLHSRGPILLEFPKSKEHRRHRYKERHCCPWRDAYSRTVGLLLELSRISTSWRYSIASSEGQQLCELHQATIFCFVLCTDHRVGLAKSWRIYGIT
jgi:hypothetical protein